MGSKITAETRAEMCLIGCLLVDPAGCRNAALKVSPAMYADGPLQKLFGALYGMSMQGSGIDPVLLDAKLGGGYRQLIVECMETLPSISHAAEYAALVLENYRRRCLMEAAAKITLGTGADSADTMAAIMQREIDRQNTIRAMMETGTAKELGAALDDAIASLSQPSTNLLTGWADIDRLGLFERGNTVVIAGRPGGGKTDFGISIASRLSRNYRTMYLSMEETRNKLTYRVLSRVTHIDHDRIRAHKLSQQELQTLTNAAAGLKRHQKLILDSSSGVTVDVIRAKVCEWRPEVLVVDHCGLVVGETAKDKPYEVISRLTHALKAMAMERGMVVIELVQLNRATDKSGGVGQATLADLKGSGSYEEDANAVIIVENSSNGNSKPLHGDDYKAVNIRVEKNRDGSTGRVPFRWQPQYHDWQPEPRDDEPPPPMDVGGYAGPEYEQTKI